MTPDEDFLVAYAEKSGWHERGGKAIMRKLCEEYRYDPETDREFIMICYGWIWGRTGNETEANCYAHLLRLKLDEAYAVVARENGW